MIVRLRTLLSNTLRRPPQVGSEESRRRWRRGVIAGGIPALTLQIWMLTAGTWNLLRWDRSADYYEAQARAMLKGALAIDPRVLGIEAFGRAGNKYMYFGPIPALYRVPVVAITDRLDGRLGALSMLVAFVVIVMVLVGLGWRLRHLVLGDAPVTRGEQVATAGMIFVIVGGSSLLYASSRTWVYHEAILWGVAYTLASYAALLLWASYGARRFLVWASVLATLAFLTRASVGGGAVAALGMVSGCVIAGALARRFSVHRRTARLLRSVDWVPQREASRQSITWLAAATVTPIVSYAAVNYVKFRTFFSVPFEQQGFTLLDPQRQRMLAANGGSLFNWKFLPSNLVQYWRPDMLSISWRWPFISYPQRQMALIGGPFYDLIDLTAGIPTTMSLLVVFGLIGFVAILRGKSAEHRALIPVMVGCAVATLAVLNIGYIANRYQSDFLPLIVVPALIGFPLAIRYLRERRRAVRVALTSLCVAAGTFSLLANLALGYTFQRAYAPVTPPYQIASYIHTQLVVDDWLGDGRLPNVRQGDQLPDGGSYGDIFIVGDCEAAYWSDGMVTNAVKLSNWNGFERAEGYGAFEADISFERPDRVISQPIVTTSGGAGGATVFVTTNPITDRMNFGYHGPDGGWLGAAVDIDYDVPLNLRLVVDPRVRILEMYIDGRLVLASQYTGGMDLVYGENTYDDALVQDRFAGTITPRPIEMNVCRELLPSVSP